MGQGIGFAVVVIIIGLLIYEFVRQIIQVKRSETKDKRDYIMIIALGGIIVGYSLNILVAVVDLNSTIITSSTTASLLFISFGTYIGVKFGKRKLAK